MPAATPQGQNPALRPRLPAPVQTPAQAPGRDSEPPPSLPPIPDVDGPLAIRVIYPNPGQTLTTRDSNFVLGSIGSGRATLTINGTDVEVRPNGAFLAWLPVPDGAKPRYEIVATRGADRVTSALVVNARTTAVPLPESGKLVVDRNSVQPAGRLSMRGEERVRVSIRAPQNATVSVRTAAGATLPTRRTGSVFSADVAAQEVAKPATVIVERDGETLRVPTGSITIYDPAAPSYAELVATSSSAATTTASDTDQVVIARPAPEGTYKWFLLPGTVVEVTGRRGDWARVRLDEQLEVWLEERNTRALPAGTTNGRRTAGNARVSASGNFSDVRIPVTERPAYSVTQSASDIQLTLYNTSGNTDIVNLFTSDPTVRDVTWEQVATDRVRYTIHLMHAPFGFGVLWERGALLLKVRHAPRVVADRPLAGRVIAVDAGHPPIGSTGPTGFYEGDATLQIAEQLRQLLEEKGATVFMTRTTRAAVALNERPVMARRANADVFVSIHLNALPDGANPYRAALGSGTYYFHDQSEPLARSVQKGLVRRMGLRDNGIFYDNLAVARNTWLPAILAEGAFLIMPEQEAALRTPEFQRRYARGIAEGVEDYFRSFVPPSRVP